MTRFNFRLPRIIGILSASLLLAGALFGCGNQIVTRSNAVDAKLMVKVPAGEFKIGTSKEQAAGMAKSLSLDPARLTEESPQRTVSLGEFYIDQTPVTNAEYKKFIDAHPGHALPHLNSSLAQSYNWDASKRTFPAGRDQYPVVLVTWHDANDYCQWAGGRLPTEAEWEKAARGMDARIFPWGDQWAIAQADAAPRKKLDAAPVGQQKDAASPYGALDMVGNVWQWTSSLNRPYPYDANDGREDRQAAGDRIVRGGSWLFGPAFTRTATRNRFAPDDKSLAIGFRCAE